MTWKMRDTMYDSNTNVGLRLSSMAIEVTITQRREVD